MPFLISSLATGLFCGLLSRYQLPNMMATQLWIWGCRQAHHRRSVRSELLCNFGQCCAGTLGRSDTSGYCDSQLEDLEDQDASTATLHLGPAPTTILVRFHRLNFFRLTLTDDDEQNGFRIDGESAHNSEEDTKKSFDFTGQIKRLNESSASD